MRWVRLALGLALAGCGTQADTDDLPRQAVSGTVNFDGRPLDHGRIVFQPASTDARPPAGGDIKDGRFAIPRDQGPTPGEYRVMISSTGPAPPGTDAPPGTEEVRAPAPPRGASRAVRSPRAAPELIPQEYNAKTKLTAKVEAGKPHIFEFTLTK